MAPGVACPWQGWEMRTWGLDLATTPSNTGLVSIDWADGGRVRAHRSGERTIEAIVDLISNSEHREDAAARGDYWAVDVPFGWPDGFGAFVATHHDGPTDVAQFGRTEPDSPRRPWQAVSHRVSDRRVRDALKGVGGFDVSFDKLGATAAAWSVIEFQLAHRGVRVDRSGLDPGARVVETWPAAAWRIWAPGLRPPLPATGQPCTRVWHPCSRSTLRPSSGCPSRAATRVMPWSVRWSPAPTPPTGPSARKSTTKRRRDVRAGSTCPTRTTQSLLSLDPSDPEN